MVERHEIEGHEPMQVIAKLQSYFERELRRTIISGGGSSQLIISPYKINEKAVRPHSSGCTALLFRIKIFGICIVLLFYASFIHG